MATLTFMCALVVLLIPMVCQGSEDRILVGWGYSGEEYGHDTSGIHLWSAAGELGVGRTFAVIARAYHGRFTDYPSIGRIYITPVGVGSRVYFMRERVSPYAEVTGGFVNFRFGVDGDHVEAGVQVGTGIVAQMAGALAVDIAAVYLHTGSWELNYFDAGPVPVEGLNHFALTVAVALRLGE